MIPSGWYIMDPDYVRGLPREEAKPGSSICSIISRRDRWNRGSKQSKEGGIWEHSFIKDNMLRYVNIFGDRI